MRNILFIFILSNLSYFFSQINEYDLNGNYLISEKIGNQRWMSCNLNTDKFANGDAIPEAKSEKAWLEAYNKKQPAWCYFENKSKNGKIYGKLYNWYAVNDSRGLAQKAGEFQTMKILQYLTVL